MSPSSDIGPAQPAAVPPTPRHWHEAVASLVASRLALIQLESKEIASGWVRRVVLLAAVGLCVLFAWALLLAGVIALVAQSTGWPWSWVAIGAAVLHLVIAIVCANLAKAPAGSAFPVTRAEFKKDREWIETLQKPTKSGV